jgi:heme exporter protein D
MTEFFAMGGYAPYVWSAYGITLLVILLNIWSARRARVRPLERIASTADDARPRRQPTVRQVE